MWMTYLVLFPIPSLYMKKRILFLLALYFMWLPLLAIQKPVFMLYHHALASGCSLIDYLKVITHGLLLDCTIAGYLTALPLLMTLVSVWLPGSFYRKLLKGYFGIMAVLIAAIRGCGFIRLLGIQAGCDSFLLSSITRRCDGKCTAGAILCPIADVRRICFRDILGVEEVYRSALPRNTGEKTIGRKPYHYPVRRDTLHSDTRRRNDFDGERGDGIFQPKPIPQPFGNQSLFQPDRFT